MPAGTLLSCTVQKDVVEIATAGNPGVAALSLGYGASSLGGMHLPVSFARLISGPHVYSQLPSANSD